MPERGANTNQLRIQKHVRPQFFFPTRWIGQWKPADRDQVRRGFGAARRRRAVNHLTRVRPPTRVGAVRRIGGSVVEHRADGDTQSGFLAYLTFDATLLGVPTLTSPARQKPDRR